MIFNIPKSLTYHTGIYTITNNHDNRFYIGSTLCFRKRFNDHKNRLKKKKHANPYLQAFSNKHGFDTLSFNLLYVCDKHCLVFNEKHWIETLKPPFNVKKIINRPISDEEMRYNHEEFLKILPTIKTPLCYLIEKCGKDWWDKVCSNNSDSPEEIRKIETGYYSKIVSPLTKIQL